MPLPEESCKCYDGYEPGSSFPVLACTDCALHGHLAQLLSKEGVTVGNDTYSVSDKCPKFTCSGKMRADVEGCAWCSHCGYRTILDALNCNKKGKEKVEEVQQKWDEKKADEKRGPSWFPVTSFVVPTEEGSNLVGGAVTEIGKGIDVLVENSAEDSEVDPELHVRTFNLGEEDYQAISLTKREALVLKHTLEKLNQAGWFLDVYQG